MDSPVGTYTGTWYQGGSQGPFSLKVTDSKGMEFNGEGDDSVGKFEITGQYNAVTKEISFKKQYIGKHALLYKGKGPLGDLEGTWEQEGNTANNGEWDMAKDAPKK